MLMCDDATLYNSRQVAVACGVTLRELQWWDEKGIVSPSQDKHRRYYTSAQVETVKRIKELRRTGLGLTQTKKFLKWQFKNAIGIRVPTMVGDTLVVPSHRQWKP